MGKRRYTPEIPPGTDIAVLNEFAGRLVREKAQLLEKVERLEAQLAQQAAPAKVAFQFVRNIYSQDGTLLAGPELFNDCDGLDYVRIKGRNWATENGYELISNFDYVFEINDVGSDMVFFYDIALPDWCKSIILKRINCVFTDKKTYKRLFPESTPFN